MSAKECSTARELRRALKASDPALERRVLSIDFTLLTSPLRCKFYVRVDAEHEVSGLTVILGASAGFIDAVLLIQDYAAKHPAPDYAALNLRASMASASL